MKARLFSPILAAWSFVVLGHADTIELMNGNRVEGRLLANDTAAKTVTVEATVGGQTITRTLPHAQVHAITANGQRIEFTPKAGGVGAAAGAPTPASVKALIERVGPTPPDWLAGTKLDYPKTLDLSWPQKPEGGWSNQKHVSHYVWDIINTNESRWREGLKFMHHVLEENKGNAEVKERATLEIANMYFRFFQDYARAAWWWQQAGITEEDRSSVLLAECYWRLGSKDLAMGLISGRDGWSRSVKLLGDMGETDRAVQRADDYAKSMAEPQEVLKHAGDACRLAGRTEQAIDFYERVLAAPVDPKNPNRQQRNRNHAQASLDALKLAGLADVAKVPDGSYQSSSLGYEGPVQVSVSVRSGRIESVKVTQHREKQFYSSMKDVPAQILAKQGVKGVDATSRATLTGNAIINATAKALAGGAAP